MDMDGIADHGKTNGVIGNAFGFRYAHGGTTDKSVYFPECTNIVLKSGELWAASFQSAEKYQYGFNHDYVLPKCYRIELYGGHLVGGTARFADIVLGGEVWLYSNRSTNWAADLHTTHDNSSASTGCLTIDAARGTNGTCTSVLKGGQVNFIKTASANSSVTVKNWKSIPASRSFKVLLDLSETLVNQNSKFTDKVSVPDIVYPEGSEGELRLKWEMNPEDETKPYRLLGRRVPDGTILIFR